VFEVVVAVAVEKYLIITFLMLVIFMCSRVVAAALVAD
jgi:hypothetical protein